MALAFDEKAKGCGNLPASSRAAAENTSSAPSSVSRRGSAGFAEEVQVFNYPGRGFQGSRHALNRICAQAQKPHGHAHGAAMRIGGTPGQRRPPAFKAGRALSTWFRVPAHCGSKALKSPQAHCILFARNAKPKETTPICRAGKCCLSTFRAVSSAHVVWVKGVEILADVSQDASIRTARKSQYAGGIAQRRDNGQRKTKGNRAHSCRAGYCHLSASRADHALPERLQACASCGSKALNSSPTYRKMPPHVWREMSRRKDGITQRRDNGSA